MTDGGTNHDEERDLLTARLAWVRDQLVLHRGILMDLQVDGDDAWYRLGKVDARKGFGHA